MGARAHSRRLEGRRIRKTRRLYRDMPPINWNVLTEGVDTLIKAFSEFAEAVSKALTENFMAIQRLRDLFAPREPLMLETLEVADRRRSEDYAMAR